jgi:predicted ATPase/DNA-binding SARP family transcriptional activator
VRPELRVLGPLELVGEGGVVALSGQKHRSLLVALALAEGRACSADSLVEALWGETPPPSARKLLHVYVSQLRKVLPAGLAVVTRSAGYALDFAGASVDAERFEQLVEEARDALDAGNPALAASLAEQALGLWRGPAYADVAYEDFAQGEAERLEELRLVASETRLDAQLRLGRHDEVLGEILAVADGHPLRERVQELAMLALYRSGRQVDALERYASHRRRLDDELGLEPGQRLRELQRRILQQDVALHVTAAPVATASLPEPPNRLVGREPELEALTDLLARRAARLLVLTGAGGSGKTRLALEAARSAAPSYANGAVLVELAPLRESELVVPTIAQAFEVADTKQPLDALAEALRPRELLLLLDNAEHVREAAPAFVELLSRAPHLTVLVTSRAVLHLSGEHVFPIAPLDDDAAQELFEQRARSLEPEFRITQDNHTAVREICRRVDGLPLAVELAAARIRALTPEAVLERLTKRLSFLAGGPRDLPARQQTLHETLDWSFDLLSEEERRMLARLSVFRGGATLAAIAAVCLDGDEGRALDLVERLADASLLLVRRLDGEARYDLLETVRQYAAERLEELGAEEPRRRHAESFVALAERAEPELSGEHQTRWFSRLELEHDNARAALAFLLEQGEAELALRLTVTLSRFWYVRGHLGEARRNLEAVLPSASEQDPLLLRRAQTAGASIALLQGDYAASTAFAEHALDSARRGGEPRFVANALSNLGAIVHAAGDEARAVAVLEEAVALAREVGDERITALALNNLGDLALSTGDYRRARPLFEESLQLLRARGDTANIARSLFNLGAVALMLEDTESAATRFRESLELAREADDQEDIAWCLEGFAALATRAGDGERAATLGGAAGALLRTIGADFKPFERRLHESTEARARSLCGASAFEEASSRGASLPLSAVLELVQAGQSSSSVSSTELPDGSRT